MTRGVENIEMCVLVLDNLFVGSVWFGAGRKQAARNFAALAVLHPLLARQDRLHASLLCSLNVFVKILMCIPF